MDWAVDFVSSPSRDDLRAVRETVEAKVKHDQGQYGEAARILWELLIQVRRAKNKHWECVTMFHMAKVYRVLRGSIAVHFFDEAIEMSRACQFNLGTMIALAEYGECKCMWGRFKEALDLFEEALSLVEPEDPASRRQILLNMAIAHEGLGELPRCKTLLEEVLKIDKTLQPDDMTDDLDHYQRLCQTAGG
jgi:hypothetical protein